MAIGTFRPSQEMAEKTLGIKPPWYVERTDLRHEEGAGEPRTPRVSQRLFRLFLAATSWKVPSDSTESYQGS